MVTAGVDGCASNGALEGVATIRLYETKRSTPRACAGFAGGRHMMRSRVPELDKVKPNTPLRLDVAAAIVFPDGSMTACGLRKEAGRGRLVIERIAGKDYTTLAAIERMRELCRQNPKVAIVAPKSKTQW